jgi:hypothetical protein
MQDPAVIFADALDDYVNAKVDYRTSTSEWKSGDEVSRASAALDVALKALILSTVREALAA